MDKIDSTTIKLEENIITSNSTEEEAEEYFKVLYQHPDLNISFEDPDFPLKFSTKSWERIIQLMDEEKIYSLAFIIFSMTNEVEESDIWIIKKNKQNGESGDDKVIEALLPQETPILMGEDDFNQFTEYFNQKESKIKKIQISNKKELQLHGKELDGIQMKEEVNQPVEIASKIIKDKNDIKRENTIKATSSTLVFQKPIYKMEEEAINNPVQEIFKDKAPIKGLKEKKIDISKPNEVREIVYQCEPQLAFSKKRIITKNGKNQVFKEPDKSVEEKLKIEVPKSHEKKKRSKNGKKNLKP